MGVSQTKNNLRWSVFVFGFLCLFSTALFVAADESSTIETTVFDDADKDGLSSDEEKVYGTDPEVADTDGDSYSDGVEIEGGFDPLKPAPGDRVVSEESLDVAESDSAVGTVNLTAKASEELAALVTEKSKNAEGGSDSESVGSSEITSEDLSTVMANVMAASQEEIVLPDVDISDIEIKPLSTKLSDDEKEEQNRQDVVEYLTLTSYILISNAPVQIRDTAGLKNFALDAGNQMVLGLLSGNYSYLDKIEERAQNALDEVNQVEVPESMLATHVKTIKMLTFASNLKDTVKASVSTSDPLGQMYMFSKVQGFLMSLGTFMEEMQSQLTAFGITNIPLDI